MCNRMCGGVRQEESQCRQWSFNCHLNYCFSNSLLEHNLHVREMYESFIIHADGDVCNFYS